MRKSFILGLCLSLTVFAAACSRSGGTVSQESGGSQTARTTTEAAGTEYETSSETAASAGSSYGNQSSSSDVTDTYPVSRLEGANGFYRLESDGDTAASLWKNTAERTKALICLFKV